MTAKTAKYSIGSGGNCLLPKLPYPYRGWQWQQCHLTTAKRGGRWIPPKLPGPIELGPYLEKLERHPGSVILVAIEIPEVCNFTRTTWAWISREERKALRRALEQCRRKREKSHDVDRSDLAAVSEANDSGPSL